MAVQIFFVWRTSKMSCSSKERRSNNALPSSLDGFSSVLASSGDSSCTYLVPPSEWQKTPILGLLNLQTKQNNSLLLVTWRSLTPFHAASYHMHEDSSSRLCCITEMYATDDAKIPNSQLCLVHHCSHTKCVIHSRQCYCTIYSNFFDLQSSILGVNLEKLNLHR